ncbi:quaternary amine ABC transporter ATP-binding protein [Spartinivicinus poritis]|uniref:Quaternary amine transport ATP-binding protein n=1 Tax=Spartinivicinus poritis TaxID=2994640 RepID=A0ABT5U776_9GAMM|nr:glycine betaine/L-proline ABC transporter ATP-binding protein [Spartinivicinus sp. A2-2]MDE1462219.1 glycine betaine/L-proline ABC transporter ATP-binding protein [Spartinivicinus sp. A2-2]
MKIEVRNIYKLFGPRPKKWLEDAKAGLSKPALLEKSGHTIGLRNINLNIEAGQIYVIMGLSGSGKSTLIRHFNRLIEPTAGQIIVDGIDVMAMSKRELEDFRRHKVSMVFQRFGLLPHKTIIDNVAYGLAIQGISKQAREEKALYWLDQVGLTGFENQYPDQLSGGMQQRVGLARALATDPDILLMDEAFSALDPLIRREMQDQLMELQEKLNKTIIFITHDLDEALRLGNRIAILRDGELIQEGTPEDILLNPENDYVQAFLQDVNRGKVLTAGHATKQPGITLTTRTTPQKALEKLKQQGLDYACVLEGKALKGIVTHLDITKANQAQAKEIGRYVQEAITIPDDAELQEVLPQLLTSKLPVAVTNKQGEFKGWLSKTKVIDLVA